MLAHGNQVGHKIYEFSADGGVEYDNTEVKEILLSHGIIMRLTAPHLPEQNGGNKRNNRTVIEMARTFKYSKPY